MTWTRYYSGSLAIVLRNALQLHEDNDNDDSTKIMMMTMVMVTVKNDDVVNMMGTRTTIDDNDDAMLNFIP